MSRPRIRHGTRNCYLHGCRRFECKVANSRYDQAWKERRRQGPIMVSAAAVRRHLRYLIQEVGVGLSAVARSADVDPATVHKVLRGTQPTIHGEKAERILAVGASDSRYVDGAETWRRIRELQAEGANLYEIAEVVRGSKPRTVDYVGNPRPGRYRAPVRRPFGLNRRGPIRRANAEAIERFYVEYFHEVLRRATPDELSGTRPQDRPAPLRRGSAA